MMNVLSWVSYSYWVISIVPSWASDSIALFHYTILTKSHSSSEQEVVSYHTNYSISKNYIRKILTFFLFTEFLKPAASTTLYIDSLK